MEENLKNRLLLILLILSAIFFLWGVSSCSNAVRQKKSRDKEMASRLDFEEKVTKLSQEKTALEAKADVLARDLEAEKVAHQAAKKALLQEQLVNQSLKEELQKVTRLKEALEEDLKESLTGKGSKSGRK